MRRQAICESCGKVFNPRPDKKGRFCSWDCAQVKNLANRNRVKQICEGCGKSFTARPDDIQKGWGRFCSRKCGYPFHGPPRVSRMDRQCLACSQIFKVPETSKQKFCSRTCAASYPRPKVPRRDGRVETTCEHCGAIFKTQPALLKRGHSRFCSVACSNTHRDTRVLVNCDFCGTGFRTRPARPHRFCSRECQAKDICGANNPRWMGGISFEPYGLQFDDALREQIRRRDDYICQICGVQQNGRIHSVHHINYDKKDNRPDNLITLCVVCHGKTGTNRHKWIWHFTAAPQLTSRAI